MKGLITLFLLFSLLCQGQNDFGTIIFARDNYKSPISCVISINSIKVSFIGAKTKVHHKVYSEGNILVEISSGNTLATPSQFNINIKNNDTVYIKVVAENYKINTSIVSKAEINKEENQKKYGGDDLYLEHNQTYRKKNYSNLYTEENTNFPYNSLSSKKIFKGGERTGSGFLISSEGYIITNYHVIEGSGLILVKGVNGNKSSSLHATIILKDETNDLAILKLTDKIILDKVPYIINTIPSGIGQKIFVLGYPLTSTMGTDIKLTDGLISSKNGYMGNINSYQISAPVHPGNSGGPLFDENGNLIGIINAKHKDAESVSYAIKSKYLIDLIASLDKPFELQQQNLFTETTLSQKIDILQNFVYLIEVK